MDKSDNHTEQSEEETGERNKCLYTFDELLRLIGGFGRYQRFLFKFLSFGSILAGAQFGLQYFYGATPDFSCVSMPSNETCDPGKCCQRCQKYEFHGPLTSAVSEWELICDRRHLKTLIHVGYMAGMCVGTILLGRLSDNFGRKVAFFVSLGFQAIFAPASAMTDSLALFIFLRFIAGVFTSGFLVPRFVYCVEIVTTANHSFFGFIVKLFAEPAGGFVLTILAAWITNWRHLMLVVSVPCFLPLIFWWYVPRSPRWLIASNHLDEAYKVLMKYATNNHVVVDSEHLKHVIQEVRKNDIRQSTGRKYESLDIVKSSKLRKRSFILLFNWFVISVVYVGLQHSVNNLQGNMPVNVKHFFLFLNEAPCVAVCFCLKRFGRRLSYSSFMTFSGLICILALAVPSGNEYQFLIVINAFAGKFFIYSAYIGLNLHTAELYPTVLRNTALGISGFVLYIGVEIGGAIAPCVASLGDVPDLGRTFPFLVFGILSLAAGITECWLPETSTCDMPQTVEQTETWDEDYNFYCCKKPVIFPWSRLDEQTDMPHTTEQPEATDEQTDMPQTTENAEERYEDNNFYCCKKIVIFPWSKLDEQIDMPQVPEQVEEWEEDYNL